MDEERKYNITVTESQALLLERALDLFTRIGIGQFENIIEVYDHDFRLDAETKEHMRTGTDIAKRAVGHPTNGSYGIHNTAVSNDFRVAYDLQQVIRHRRAWARCPGGGFGVSFDEPYSISGVPLAQMAESKTV